MVDPGDHDALVDALDAVVADEALRARLVAAGTAWSAGFSWERCGAGLEELYRDAAGGHG
jgi:glycosyltransferase involved in cell wall biosynthesis